jgi:hypothetical protein
VSTRLLDKSEDLRKAQSRPLADFFRREEGLECVGNCVGGHPDTSISKRRFPRIGRAELHRSYGHKVSVTFIPAKLFGNPALLRVNQDTP